MVESTEGPGGARNAGPCPCGSGKAYGECCGPVIAGKRLAATAEELMRARFTAHATHDLGFVHRTYRPTSRQPFVPFDEEPTTEWNRLVIHSHLPGKTPDVATVDFSAYGKDGDAEQVIHENAEFVREGGAWIYTRSLREGPVPYKDTTKKPGRNEPCPCGSGKKYKHCCLAKA
jgi:SEC-C motif-containing protein